LNPALATGVTRSLPAARRIVDWFNLRPLRWERMERYGRFEDVDMTVNYQ